MYRYLIKVLASVAVLIGSYRSQCTATNSDIAATLYDLELDLTQRRVSEFSGAANITFVLKKANLKDVRLDAIGLNIDSKSIRLVDVFSEKPVKLEEVRQDDTSLTITTKSKLVGSREYRVSLQFKGTINTDTIGLFRSYFINADRQVQSYLATNLYPDFARRVFPCVDEPSQNSNFSVSFIHNRTSTILFNTPAKGTQKVSRTANKTTFEVTPRIPVHLLTFVVSDFKELHKNESAKLATWGLPSAKEALRECHDIAAAAILLAEDLVGVPATRTNIVVLPNMPINVLGAGLILLSEERLALKAGLPTSAVQSAVVSMSKYVASQWAGFSLRPESWGAEWILAGFRNLLQIRLAAKIKPEWNVELQYETGQMNRAFLSDEGYDVSLNDLNETTVSSGFAGAKGVSTLMMAETFMNSSFWRGTRRFFRAFSSRAIDVADFINVLESQAEEDNVLQDGVTVFNVINTWSTQSGYPVVTVIGNNGSTCITQESIFHEEDEEDQSDGDKEASWWIPLAVATQDDRWPSHNLPRYWLPAHESLQLDNIAAKDQWVYFNINRTGPFRVNYDLRNWNRLNAQLKSPRFDEFPLPSRAQMVTDALSLARANLLPWSTALDTLSYMKDEKEYIPWKFALNELAYIRDRMRGSPVLDLFKKYMARLTRNAFLEAFHPFEIPTGHTGYLMNETISWWACWAGLSECNSAVDEYFLQWHENHERFPPPDLSASVFCSAIRKGNTKHVQEIITQLKNENSSLARTVYLQAIACAPPKIKSIVFVLLINLLRNVYDNDGVFLYKAILQNSDIETEATLEFLEEHYSTIRQAARSDAVMIQLLRLHAANINTKPQLQKLEKIIDTSARSLKDLLEGSLRVAQYNLERRTKHLMEIETWLKVEMGER